LHFKEYATPVFENEVAQELYKYMHPQTYQRKIEGKAIFYFSTYKRDAKTQPCNELSHRRVPVPPSIIAL
ncbi:MAG: hypothetical protein CW691_01275, partial [Candidatus Bathyarchaeum sp.]